MTRWRSWACGPVAVGVVFALGGALSGAGAQTGEGAGLLARSANLGVEGVSIIDALRRLQARSAVPIGFSPETLPADLRVSCACTDKTVQEALEILLEGTGLIFTGRRNQILVTRPNEPEPAPPETGIVTGMVREIETGRPVAAARVALRELRMATITGKNGRFLILSVPPGAYTLDVDALGFRSEGVRRAEVTLDGPTILELGLMRDPLALAEIVVAPGTFGIGGDEVTLMRQTLTEEQMQALPQLGEDVFRTMERIPGVATGDISAKMAVRGAYPDELLIQLDGVELFEPYHMKDMDAVMGIVDVRTLGGLDLVAGGLPTQYGDRMTGLLDMRTKQPIGNGRRNSIGFSISNITARSQGTFNDGRGGWLVSGRRGFLDILLAMAQDGKANEDVSPRYFDAMGKVELLVGARHRFSAHVLYAGDDLTLKAFDSDIERGELRTDWRNANAWLNWAWQFSPSMDASTVLSFASLSRSRTGFDLKPGSSEIADAVTVRDRSAFDFLTAKQDWRWAVADKVVLKFGGQLRFSKARYNYRSEIGQEFDLGDGTVGVDVDSVHVSLQPKSTETGVYLATRLQPLDRLVLEVGGRYDYRTHTADSDISPRIQAALELTTNTTLRASWGAYFQSHGIDELSAVDGDTLFFPSERAHLIAAGIEHGFARGWQVRAEVYHRTVAHPRPRYLNVIREIIPFPEVGNDRVRFLPEKGRADGLELTVAGPLGNQSDWTASYVLARTEDKLDGRWVPRTFDQRHTFNTRWHYRPNDAWEFSAGWQYHTGWPSTPMEFQVDTLGVVDPDNPPPGFRSCDGDGCVQLLINERPGPINALRLPAYHRMDIRATRTFQVGGGTLSAFLDVFNLYNRENLRSYDYWVELPSGRVNHTVGETLLPILPSFGLTWEF